MATISKERPKTVEPIDLEPSGLIPVLSTPDETLTPAPSTLKFIEAFFQSWSGDRKRIDSPRYDKNMNTISLWLETPDGAEIANRPAIDQRVRAPLQRIREQFGTNPAYLKYRHLVDQWNQSTAELKTLQDAASASARQVDAAMGRGEAPHDIEEKEANELAKIRIVERRVLKAKELARQAWTDANTALRREHFEHAKTERQQNQTRIDELKSAIIEKLGSLPARLADGIIADQLLKQVLQNGSILTGYQLDPCEIPPEPKPERPQPGPSPSWAAAGMGNWQ